MPTAPDETAESSSCAAVVPSIIDNPPFANANHTTWFIEEDNITALFKRYYRQHIDTLDLPFHLKTSLKELLAVADILSLAPTDHSPTMITVFGLQTLNKMCDQVMSELLLPADIKITDMDFIKVDEFELNKVK